MIPATTPYVARYKQTFKNPDESTGSYIADMPVMAWDDDGDALVASNDRGRLVLASSYSNFVGVAEADPHVVAVIPATGWQAQYKEDDGSTFNLSLVAFLIESDGGCKPIRVDSDGFSDDARDSANFLQLIDPSQTEAES